jgi:hypothetical protein
MSFSKLLQNVDKFFWRILPNKIKFWSYVTTNNPQNGIYLKVKII